ncbi:MAG: SoxR reducing system RseC family protein [Bacteroides sp.]|nr:SoxR reducing system RseC family protein [Bacteroides sp.]
MAENIKHQGVVENIAGSCLKVRIVQTSACATCNIKGHCTSADTKEKLIDAVVTDGSAYRVGDRVWVAAQLSMGVWAIVYAFVLPFLVLVVALFAGMAIWGNELWAALCALLLLVPYYYVLWLNKGRMKKKFLFTVHPFV